MKTATLIASVLVIVLAPAAVQSQVEQSLIRIDYTQDDVRRRGQRAMDGLRHLQVRRQRPRPPPRLHRAER